MSELTLNLNKDYVNLLKELKAYISSARVKAALALNKEIIHMYWKIGQHLIEKQKETSWGDKLLLHLSNDLRRAFPEMRGLSETNLKYMRIFAHIYPDGISQRSVDQLPWGHLTVLMRIKDFAEREWYLAQNIKDGWSRAMLEKQIKTNLYQRQGIAEGKTSNYLTRLPEPQSHLAHELLKNPYNFDCLGLHDEAYEREIENASIKHVTKFLLELGKGFAFIGNQVPIEVSGNEYFIDMLFYHVKLHSYVVVEIKATSFKPEHAGQLNFYLSAVDDKFRTSDDNPSIGILLCKSKDKVIAEYALRGIERPIGVSEYWLTKAIPENLQTSLPTIQEIEAELSKRDDDNRNN